MKTEALLHALPARKEKLRVTSFFSVIVGDVHTKAFSTPCNKIKQRCRFEHMATLSVIWMLSIGRHAG